jgi:hypothetical protein
MTNRISTQMIAAICCGLLLLTTLWAVWTRATGPWGNLSFGLGAIPGGAGRTAVEPEDLGCHAPAAPAQFDLTYTGPTGRTIRVNGGASAARDLQAALNAAAPGDAIELEAGASFVGNFTLPEKKGDGWVTIKSSNGASLPLQGARGVRITPADSPSLPKIITPNAEAAIKTAPRAHHYWLAGIEMGVSPGVKQNSGLVLFGDGSGAQASLAAVPHDLVLDRCYVHGNGTGELRRGVALNSARTAVIDSYIAACQGIGYDTQAIAGWNGPGPFKIINNYLEGAGENIMFGGADPAIPNLVPSDIEFRNNHCAKPLAWKRGESGGKQQSVKNLFELKSARRVLADGNVFEHNWADAQNGFAILMTVRNQDGGAPWSVVEDVVFSRNIVRNVGAGINLLGRDDNHASRQLKRVRIEQNLFEGVGGEQWGGNGCFLQLTESACVVVDRNTVFHTGNVIMSYGQPNPNFVFTNNLARHNEYGVIGDAVGSGKAALEKYFPVYQFTGNVLAGGRSEIYPLNNFFPVALDSRLEDRSGTPAGADVVVLRNLAEKVLAGK